MEVISEIQGILEDTPDTELGWDRLEDSFIPSSFYGTYGKCCQDFKIKYPSKLVNRRP